MTVTVTHDPDLKVPDRDGRQQPQGARLILRTPFAMKDRVKALPGARWAPQGAGASGEYHKVWHVPATVEAAGAVKRLLDRYETAAQLDRTTLELIARAEQSADAQQYKTRDDLSEIPGNYCQCPDGPKLTDENGEDTQGVCDRCHISAGSWMHQRQGFHWALPRDGAGLIMDMGTGKSKVTIALAEHWNVQLMVVLAPPRAVRVWPKQFRLHAARDWIVVNHGGRRRDGKLRGISTDGRGKVIKASMRDRVTAALAGAEQARRERRPFCIVVPYEVSWQEPIKTFLLTTLPEQFGDGRYGLGVVDEGHKIKSPSGKWSRMAERLSHVCARRLDTTGTMMPHSELDVYAQARFLDPGVFGTSYQRFKTHYFKWGGFEGRQLDRDGGTPFLSPEREREFLGKLAGMTFVVESDDVLDLPPQMHQPPIGFALGDAAARHYRELLEDWQTQIGDADLDDPLVVENVLSQMMRLAQVTSGHLPILNAAGDRIGVQEIGREKIGALEDLLEDVSAGEPIVVFCRFRPDLENVEALAAKLGLRYGEISGRRQDGLTEDATMNPDIDLCGVQLQAGGVGIDLTRARYAIYYSLDFNLGDYDQSVKRVHRPGQRRETFYYYLVAEGTIDEVILHALRTRSSVVRGVVRAIKSGDFDPEAWE